jgi:hypothetical protein
VNNVLTIAQIEKRFDGEWVLVGDPVKDASLKVRSGIVLAHSKDRDEVYRAGVKLRPRRSAILYLGEFPEDTAIVL